MEDGRIFHVKELFFPIHILQGSCLKMYNIKGSRILGMVRFGCFCVKSSRTQTVTVKSKLGVIALGTCTCTCTCTHTHTNIAHALCAHAYAITKPWRGVHCIVPTAKRLGHVRWTTLLFADALGSVQYEFWRYDVTEFIHVFLLFRFLSTKNYLFKSLRIQNGIIF